MPVSRNRPRAKKQNSNHTLIDYNRRTIRDLSMQIRRLDDVIEYTLRVTRGMIDQTRSLVGVDNQYINGLLKRVITAATELNGRLNGYRTMFEDIRKNREGDITGKAMNLYGHMSEETHNIDSNIFQPVYDVQEEINNHADEQDRICLNMINQYVDELKSVHPENAANA